MVNINRYNQHKEALWNPPYFSRMLRNHETKTFEISGLEGEQNTAAKEHKAFVSSAPKCFPEDMKIKYRWYLIYDDSIYQD